MLEDVPDPTAGRRARMIREQPERDQPIADPTDPRYGEPGRPREQILIADPTDPRYGEPAA